jgi:dipeptidyl aminopeptidase/acylaminoacyl peptidase
MKQNKPYGLWTSPISAEELSQGIRLNEVRWDAEKENLVWLEGRSGQGVLVASDTKEPGWDLNQEISCRGGVGYGGGEFDVLNDVVIFSGKDGRLYRRELGYDRPRAITPSYGGVASPKISPDGEWVVYVFSDGSLDVLAVVDSEGKQWPRILQQGADFYMQPAWSPNGKQITWIEWDHPHMPWEATRLMVADVVMGDLPELRNIHHVDGNDETIIFQPEFSPDGTTLSYIRSAEEWDEFVLYDLAAGKQTVLLAPQGVHLTIPAWVQGIRTYAWMPDSKSILYIQYEAGFTRLYQVEIKDRSITEINIQPYTWIRQIHISKLGRITAIVTSPQITPRIVIREGDGWRTVARSSPENINPEYLPMPEAISWQAEDGSEVYGLYYRPANPKFQSEGLPPVIIHIHGGPTSQATVRYDADISYFTSRGYGWLEVNHRGSTGYGYTYQNKLYHRWGDVDVEDAVSGARTLIDRKLANPKQLIIMGGSAGGYTVLNSLVRYPGVFKAGVSLYGISNLFTLDQDIHKFEAHNNDFLIGTLPEAAERYHAWSAVFHAERIRDALAIFQGSEDTVVPQNQAEEIVKKLRQQGVPFIYQLYEGEGHGFRKNETLLDFYKQVEAFLQQNVIFAP